jgi:peptide/nickel transport system substrate-binding protein
LAVLDPIVQETQEIIRTDLAQIGVRVEKSPVAESVFYGPPTNLGSGLLFYADLSEYFLDNPSPEPSIYMGYWTCAQIPQPENGWAAGLNIPRWCDPESGYDALYQQLLTELDPDVRRELVIEMNEILIEEVVTIPLVHLAEVSGVRDEIEGIAPNPWDGLFWNVQDWRRAGQ